MWSRAQAYWHSGVLTALVALFGFLSAIALGVILGQAGRSRARPPSGEDGPYRLVVRRCRRQPVEPIWARKKSTIRCRASAAADSS